MPFGNFKKNRSLLKVVHSCLFGALIVSNVNATETVVYSEGFESNNGNYTHIGILDLWQWGTPSATFTSGPMAAHSGVKCWGTNLNDTVPFGMNAYLTSAPIALPVLGTNQVMRVRFFGWIAVDVMSDRGQFQISANGFDWETKGELLCTMQGGWNEYNFDISDYSGDSVYLRFRCFTDNENNFSPPEIPYNMAGFYIDDIAITVTDAPTMKKTLTFEGSENQSAIASCPWIYIPTGHVNVKKNTIFAPENDIYSTARGNDKEYTDYYRLNDSLKENNKGQLIFKLKETENEESFTDLFHLIVVDHAPNYEVACDENGNVFTYKDKKDPTPPTTAVDKNGASVLPLVTASDAIGYKAYDGDCLTLTFGSVVNGKHPIFLMRAQGFLTDSNPGAPITVQPKIQIQTQNSSGVWVTRNVFYPRWNSAYGGYDLDGLFPYSKKIRLFSSSCMTGKYHLIDWVAVSSQAQKNLTITDLAPDSAIRSDGTNVTAALLTDDGNRAHLAASEEITLTFTPSGKSGTKKRDIIVKSKGYYVPNGTYFFYTWDGSKWAQRDGWSIPLDGDQTREFDLSLWQPDPQGNNKIRIWQDFFFNPASVDYVGLRRDSTDLIMSYAKDLRDSSSVLDLVNVSDDKRLEWDWGADWPYRDRWMEIGWSDTFLNTPPSTYPVYVTNTSSPAPTINWTYFDLDGNPQDKYEIEVWDGSNGTGANFWDPAVGIGSAVSAVYDGAPLSTGQKYYARVKAFDGSSWGAWSEAAFTVSSNRPPVAEAGPDITVNATPSCITSVALDGSASYDPDGDALTFLWTGPFGMARGPKPAVFLNAGTYLIRLIVSDNKGGTGMDSVSVTVQDIYAPIPDSASLPRITGECGVTITYPPTATDSCAGKVVGTTDSLTFMTSGTRTITWYYNDGNGNVSTQSQVVAVGDNTAPVPDFPTLPPLSGECFVSITNYPTATDNCSGSITGTTTDSLVYSQQGTYTITWRYQDGNGNVATQTQTVTVTDHTAPVPDVATLPVLSGTCVVSVNQSPTATDACAGRIVGTTTDPLFYTMPGTYSITWRYNDGNGNGATQTQSVVVVDNTPPVPNATTLPTINGPCSASITEYPTATDACTGNIVGTTTDPLSYTTSGTYTVTWQYDDGHGNVSTQTQSVVITDNTPPVPDVAVLPSITGSCSATISEYPTATDACVGSVVGTTTDSLSYTTTGTYTVTWRYKDGHGNVATQTQAVVVTDNTAPVPDVASLPTVNGSCSVTISHYPTATDACAGSIIGTTTDPLSYTTTGTYTVTWRYNDGHGNVSTQTQTVVVADNTPPVPDIALLPTVNGSCSATISAYPTATDVCAGRVVGTTTDPLSYTTTGTYTVTWRYNDGHGNVSTQTQTVVVADNTPPVPDIASLPTINGSCSVTISAYPTATDVCAGRVVGTTTDPLSYTTTGTYTVTWRYNDGHGNVATQTQTVVVADNTPPVPDIASLPTINGSCSVTISAYPTATDVCAGRVVGTTTDPLSYTTTGTYTVTWRYNDGHGNVSTQTQLVVVNDNTPPVPDVATLPTINGSCSVAISAYPTATDVCAGRVIGTTTDPLTYTIKGTYTVTWRYNDGHGNIAAQTQTVVIADNTAPVPDVASLPVINGSCNALISAKPTATDDCKGKIVGTTTDPLFYTVKGTYTVTWRYDDGNGNSSTQTQSVVVADNTPPVPNVSPLPVIQGSCKITIRSKPTATDDCKGKIIGTTSDPLIYKANGTYTITWRYNDGNGNVSTQTQTVIVVDNTAPVPDVAQLPVINGSCSVSISTMPTATDDCKGKVVGTTNNPLVYTSAGTYTITWRYKDGNGNTSTQTQSVVVVDNAAPVPDVSPLPAVQGDCKVIICAKPIATDGCKGKIVGTTTDPLSYSKQGTYIITWRYDDGNGNVSTQTQTVIVNDITGPIPDVASLPVVQGDCNVHVCNKPTASDNCSNCTIVGKTSDPLKYSIAGIYTIHWNYTDKSGNTTTQLQTVIVRDNTAPVPNVSTLPAINGTIKKCGQCFTVKSYPSATDNCKGKIVGTTSSPLEYCYKGDFIIVWRYDDGNGNVTTQNQAVHIR